MIRRTSLNGNWPKVELGEVVEFLDHLRKPVTAKDRKPGPYPYYGANGKQDSVADFIFDEPLVLLAEDGGHFGEENKTIAYEVRGKCWVNNHAHVLRPTDRIDIQFLRRHLESYDVRPFTSGTTRLKLNKAKAAKIPLALPPLSEQKRIAAILDRAEALRAQRRAALALLDELTQSIFLDMFGDPVTNPKGWPTQAFAELGSLDRGISKHRPRNAPQLLGGPYPLVQTGDVANSGGYIRKYTSTYSEIGLRQSKLWPAGTLCITIAANIAKTGILTFESCFPDSIVGFRAAESATVVYAQHWLSFLQQTLEKKAPESAQKNINLGTLRNLPVPVPPIGLRNEFERRVDCVVNLRASFSKAFCKSADVFASLQQRAFRGEL